MSPDHAPRPDEISLRETRALLPIVEADANRARAVAESAAEQLAASLRRIADLEADVADQRRQNLDLIQQLVNESEVAVTGRTSEHQSDRSVSFELRGGGGDIEEVRSSDLFDAVWYHANYHDVARAHVDAATHYVRHGAAEGRDPGPWFSTAEYLAQNPDVEAAGVNPLLHYVRSGRPEGRTLRWHRKVDPSMMEDHATQLHVGLVTGSTRDHRRAVVMAEAARRRGANVSVVAASDVQDHVGTIRRLDVVLTSHLPAGPALDTVIALTRAGRGVVVCDHDEMTVDPDTAEIDVLRDLRTTAVSAAELRLAHDGVLTATAASVCATAATNELADLLRSEGVPAFVVRDGFDDETYARSRRFVAARTDDGVFRIGLARFTDVVPSDFDDCAKALAAVLGRHPECRLVVFVDRNVPVVDLAAHPELAELDSQIEWRQVVPAALRPWEFARLDVAISPLETGNRFCDSMSPTAFVDAALVDVPVVASQTLPFREVITHGENGFLAGLVDEWESVLEQLLRDRHMCRTVGRQAQRTALAEFGPRRTAAAFRSALDFARGLDDGVGAVSASVESHPSRALSVLAYETRHIAVGDGERDVTVSCLVDDPSLLEVTLQSIVRQTLPALDLVVAAPRVAPATTERLIRGLEQVASRFTRVTLIEPIDAGRADLRDIAFDASETPFVLSIWSGDRLAVGACERLATALRSGNAAFAWVPVERSTATNLSTESCDWVLLPGGVRRYATTMIAKEAWAAGGGFADRHGERPTNDFWTRLAQLGLTS